MNRYNLKYEKLVPGDADIPLLLDIHKLPEISKFITIDEENYFRYVTTSDNVYYFKVISENKIVAAVHIEKDDTKIYLSILTLPECQNKGFASQIISDIKSQHLVTDFSKIIVSIHRNNFPSIKLFEKSEFILESEDDGLLEYHWTINHLL